MKRLFEKAIANIKIFKEFGLYKTLLFEINEIPKVLTEFNGTKEHYWINVDLPEIMGVKKSACMYIADEGSKFPPHKHNNFGEMITVINKTGEIQVLTEDFVKVLKFGESCYIPKGKMHATICNKKTETLIIWDGSFGMGWNGEFIT